MMKLLICHCFAALAVFSSIAQSTLTFNPADFIPADTGYFIGGTYRDLVGNDNIPEYYNGCYDAHADSDFKDSGIQNGWEYQGAIIFRNCDMAPSVTNDVVKGAQPETNWPETGDFIQITKTRYALTDSMTNGYIISPNFTDLKSLTVKTSTQLSLNNRNIYILIEASKDNGETWQLHSFGDSEFIHQVLENQGGDLWTYETGNVGFDYIKSLSEEGPIRLRFMPYPGIPILSPTERGERVNFWEINIEATPAEIPENPTDIFLSKNKIEENEQDTVLIGILSAADADNNSHFFHMSWDDDNVDNEYFFIRDNQLYSKLSFDYELQNSYNITVRAQDSLGGTLTKSLLIEIEDMDDGQYAPDDIFIDNTSIPENQPIGSFIGLLSSSDKNEEQIGFHDYSLVEGDGSDFFSIKGDSLLSNVVFDFENQSASSVKVRTTDPDGYTFEKVVTVDIIDMDEGWNISDTVIFEGQAVGTYIGHFHSESKQLYSFGSGPGSSNNKSFTISGDSLFSAEVFDLELKRIYSIAIEAKDSLGGFFTKTFKIQVISEIEIPPSLSIIDNDEVELYPNPVEGEVFLVEVSKTPITLELLDLTGKILKKTQLDKLKSEITMSSYDSGVYLVRLNYNGQIVYQGKLIKK